MSNGYLLTPTEENKTFLGDQITYPVQLTPLLAPPHAIACANISETPPGAHRVIERRGGAALGAGPVREQRAGQHGQHVGRHEHRPHLRAVVVQVQHKLQQRQRLLRRAAEHRGPEV